MAWKMMLATPFAGKMPFIWNLSQEVGVQIGSPNHPEDIELIQRLVILWNEVNHARLRAAGIGKLHHAHGKMDVQTAYEILRMGVTLHHSGSEKDIVRMTPARGGQVMYSRDEAWTIAALNWECARLDLDQWQSLPERCSPGLRHALLSKTAA